MKLLSSLHDEYVFSQFRKFLPTAIASFIAEPSVYSSAQDAPVIPFIILSIVEAESTATFMAASFTYQHIRRCVQAVVSMSYFWSD